MKKLLLVSTVGVLFSAIAVPVLAEDDHDHDHDEARVEHYEGHAIATTEEALKTLKDENAEIAGILKSEKLEGSQLEQIHEISYTLENAIDKLIAEKAAPQGQLDAVDEAVQAVHHASENHEEAKVREWFAKLEPAVDEIKLGEEQAAAPSEDGVYTIVIKDHKFTPEEIRVPAGEKIKLVVDNQDPTPEEFESDDFRREKIIAGNTQATIFVGPLKPGKYHFFGEFNLDTANGYLIVE
ncbi:MAG: cupredoxin domain-containing protein [Alphaproteobacteria bacterium]|nr:cupredoxin domain-containing protein [Alphaproteobacteria bacterium]